MESDKGRCEKVDFLKGHPFLMTPCAIIKLKLNLLKQNDKCKSSACIFNFNITSMHFKGQYCLLFF